jgi:hypothetical protein
MHIMCRSLFSKDSRGTFSQNNEKEKPARNNMESLGEHEPHFLLKSYL